MSVRADIKQKVFERDNFTCLYCGHVDTNPEAVRNVLTYAQKTYWIPLILEHAGMPLHVSTASC